MAYLRCTQCGSKALVAASQCPKCAHPFNLLDARGERAKLKRCRSCGIMHRADAHCHWCGEVKGFGMPQWPSHLRVDSSVWRTAAAVALMVTAAGGVWRFAPELRDAANVARGAMQAATEATGEESRRDAGTNESQAAGTLASAPPTVTAAGTGTDSAMAMVANTTTPTMSAEDIQWTPAVARTWVNVRSDASRGGEVVGVIKPASRAMLGTDRAGWRQVRSPDVSGWVDPRLFEPDSLATRGGT